MVPEPVHDQVIDVAGAGALHEPATLVGQWWLPTAPDEPVGGILRVEQSGKCRLQPTGMGAGNPRRTVGLDSPPVLALAMDPVKNPFRPTAGATPPEIIDRAGLLDDFDHASEWVGGA